MNTIGTAINLPSKEQFKTREFFGYVVDSITIEFMGDFKIDLGNNRIYKFILDENAIVETIIIDEVKVNFTALEDWIVAYMAMNDPKKRVFLIKQYFKNSGVNYKKLLERNLSQDLPSCIEEEVLNLI